MTQPTIIEENSMATQKRGQLSVIKEYFEMSPGDIRKEGGDLSVEEKLELATESAKELGLKADEVSFPIN